MAAGADAVMIEVHDSPELAKSDGEGSGNFGSRAAPARRCRCCRPLDSARCVEVWDESANPFRWKKRATHWICFPSLRAPNRSRKNCGSGTDRFFACHRMGACVPIAAIAEQVRHIVGDLSARKHTGKHLRKFAQLAAGRASAEAEFAAVENILPIPRSQPSGWNCSRESNANQVHT